MIQFLENAQTERQKVTQLQTLFHRTLPATAGGKKKHLFKEPVRF